LKWLRETLKEEERESLDWVAGKGEKPGWDMKYKDLNGQRVAVEVKGTAAAGFTSIELTANEWAAAIDLRDKFCPCLVTSCRGDEPGIYSIRDPYGAKLDGRILVSPASWRVILADGSQNEAP
jgi:hypothetical protein